MAFGSKDTKGIYKFGEDDTKTTFSELLNTGMDSVSDAARAFSGTAAQRAAFLDAAPGSIWQDTNGTKQLWRWLDGSWKLLNLTIAEGGTGATTVAGAITNLKIGVLKVISATPASFTTVSSTSFQNTILTASITPSLASSKILVIVSAQLSTSAAGLQSFSTLYRGTVTGTNLGDATNGFGRMLGGSSNLEGFVSISYLDSPATTSSVQYMYALKVAGTGSTTVNNVGKSTITLMEVAA